MFKFAGLILILSFLVSCSSTSSKNKETAKLHLATGTQSLMAQDYTDALVNLLKADKLDPNNSAILTNLAMAYYFKGEKNTAIEILKRSISINNNNSDSKINLATIYYHDGDLAQAENLYKEVLKDLTYDKQARTLYNLGIIELDKSNSVAAENYFRKSLKESENYCPSSLQIGILKYNRKNFNEALKFFKDAAYGTCANSAAAHYYQALSYIGLNRYTDARMKLVEVDTRFKNTDYSSRARQKLTELTNVEKNEMQASGSQNYSPDF